MRPRPGTPRAPIAGRPGSGSPPRANQWRIAPLTVLTNHCWRAAELLSEMTSGIAGT